MRYKISGYTPLFPGLIWRKTFRTDTGLEVEREVSHDATVLGSCITLYDIFLSLISSPFSFFLSFFPLSSLLFSSLLSSPLRLSPINQHPSPPRTRHVHHYNYPKNPIYKPYHNPIQPVPLFYYHSSIFPFKSSGHNQVPIEEVLLRTTRSMQSSRWTTSVHNPVRQSGQSIPSINPVHNPQPSIHQSYTRILRSLLLNNSHIQSTPNR